MPSNQTGCKRSLSLLDRNRPIVELSVGEVNEEVGEESGPEAISCSVQPSEIT
jgi:hypothetical protein